MSDEPTPATSESDALRARIADLEQHLDDLRLANKALRGTARFQIGLAMARAARDPSKATSITRILFSFIKSYLWIKPKRTFAPGPAGSGRPPCPPTASHCDRPCSSSRSTVRGSGT